MNLLTIPTGQFADKLRVKKNNAKKVGKTFELGGLNVLQMRKLIGNGLCAYCNSEYSSIRDVTFERVNPLIGYTLDNTVMCCASCNRKMVDTDNAIHAGMLKPDCKFPLLSRNKQKGWLDNLKGKILDLLFGKELV